MSSEDDESAGVPGPMRHGERLIAAAAAGNLAGVQDALEKGADVNAADERGRCAMHFAVTKGSAEMVRLLLQRDELGCDQQDANGNTPLHLASVTSRADIIALLLDAGCKLDAVDQFGMTPLQWASSHLQRLRTNLSCSDENPKAAADVNALATMLASTSTTEELDGVCNLIAALASMGIA